LLSNMLYDNVMPRSSSQNIYKKNGASLKADAVF
jgi:hypothetical protein